jgi:methyl-accepting chemotaxis protein-1 (serine sensor receptor)
VKQLNVSTRLALLIGLLSAVLLGVGSLGLVGIAQSNDDLRDVYRNRLVPTATLAEIESLIVANRMAIGVAIETPTPEVVQASTATVEANIATVTKLWEGYAGPHLQGDEARLASAFAADRKAFVQQGLLPAVAALRANDFMQAHMIMDQKLRNLFPPVKKGVDALTQLQLTAAQSAYQAAEARFQRTRLLSIAAMLAGLVGTAVLGTLIARSLARQLGAEPGEVVGLAQRIAAGDLRARIELRRGDANSLMANIKSMQTRLDQVVSHVRLNAESVASASAQIAQGNGDLSQRTEQQSAALEETAAAMDQLATAVTQNADNAQRANQLALGASTVALKGGEVVGQVVQTMKGINDSSRQIAEITAVIDGIAFQTNILALNAAVEAARAGEQGRGFAVVASEVRSLAGRSAEAAKAIKGLIDTSVERVDRGTAFVNQAGLTMEEIVTAIRRVNEIVSQISTASLEQSSGVAQVGHAITQMDHATQQNAALVEQSAAAAESLKTQADQLVQAVAVFKLAQDGPAATGAGAAATPPVERRGPNRARNVLRPPFGAAAPAPGADLASEPLRHSA